MNNQIRELAVSAGYGNRWNTTDDFEQFLEQFAEEIVQECLNVVGNNICPNYPYQAIQRHFGIGSPVRTPVVTITQEEKEALSNWGTLEE